MLIIGGGPAGLTAAIYACRAGKKTLLLEKGAFGGQIISTETIENYPGFPDGISGFELMLNFQKQAKRFGCEFQNEEVLAIKTAGAIKKVVINEGEIEAKVIILATGSKPRQLGVIGETKFHGKGVSYCATCDGFLYRNKKVAVVGGGDSAVKEALYLANMVQEVVIIHRRDELRADKVLGDKALAAPNIKICWDTVVDEIMGDSKIEALKMHNIKTQQTQEMAVEGVFMYVGNQPNTEFLGTEFEKNPQGYLVTNEKMETALPGVFAIGDCRKKLSRQVATAVGDGALVFSSVEEYLAQ